MGDILFNQKLALWEGRHLKSFIASGIGMIISFESDGRFDIRPEWKRIRRDFLDPIK